MHLLTFLEPMYMFGGFWVATAVTAGTAIYGALQSKKAADKSASQVSNLQYQPIDLKALQEQARTTAEANARNSKALDAELNPDLAAVRSGSQKQVNDNLKLGGNLSPDVANAVTSASEAQGNNAGLYGGAGPITAANLGLTAQALKDQRLQQALQLSQANPLPTAGLDPGALASAAISQNNAENQFALQKTGAQSNANQSQANANSGLATTFGLAASDVLGKLAKK